VRSTPAAGNLDVDPAIWERYPDYRAVVLYASGVENGPSDERSQRMLTDAAEQAKASFGDARAADHPHIASWRLAFSGFGAKPSRYPCSAEALLARVLKGGPPPAVNRLVDAYNSVSIERMLPIGGEDRDELVGDSRLRPATGSEPFVVFHGDAEVVEHPQPGEIVWADDAGVTCRRWNWRQCARTRLTGETRNAYFLVEAIGDYPEAELEAAADLLAVRVEQVSPGARFERRTLEPR
jgi:DNA/RNA-binding domain of Phe-tRNA-synthetase-like protein